VCCRKHAPEKLGSVGQFLLFFIQFHSHLCMPYMVLYRSWHQIYIHKVCECFILIKYTVTLCDNIIQCQHLCHHFVAACNKIWNCLKSPTSKNSQRHTMYEKQTKIALESGNVGSQKIARFGDYLLGSVGIPEMHSLLFGVMC